MKRFLLSITGIFVLLYLSGCGGTSLGLSSPEQLMRAPQADSGQIEIRQTVLDYMPEGTVLTIPLHPAKSSALKELDFDGDGVDEVIAFYKKEDNDYERGLLILKKAGDDWSRLALIEGLGRDIDYADFKDIDGDGNPEIIITWTGGKGFDSKLEIYKITKGSPEKMAAESCSAMAVGDLDSDLKNDLILFKLDKSDPMNQWAEASLYQFTGQELRCTDRLRMDGYINGYQQVIYGKVNEKQKGVFIDSGVGAHSSMTEILVLEDGHLKNALTKGEESAYDKTFKAYTCLSEDINQDGIIEIGLLREAPGYENESMVNIQWIESWYQWDGKDGLLPVQESFWNSNGDYRLLIPEKWQDRFTVEKKGGKDEECIVFYCLSSRKRGDLLSIQEREEWIAKQAVIIKIYSFGQEKWMQTEFKWKEQAVNYNVLGINQGKVIVGVQAGSGDKKAPEKILLNEDELMKYFCIRHSYY